MFAKSFGIGHRCRLPPRIAPAGVRPGPGQDRGALGRSRPAEKYAESDDVFGAVFRSRRPAARNAARPDGALGRLLRAGDHFAVFPQLHELFWKAIHQGAGEAKKSTIRSRRAAGGLHRPDRRQLPADRQVQADGRLPTRLRPLSTVGRRPPASAFVGTMSDVDVASVIELPVGGPFSTSADLNAALGCFAQNGDSGTAVPDRRRGRNRRRAARRLRFEGNALRRGLPPVAFDWFADSSRHRVEARGGRRSNRCCVRIRRLWTIRRTSRHAARGDRWWFSSVSTVGGSSTDVRPGRRRLRRGWPRAHSVAYSRTGCSPATARR